jgi:hypothetical protein
MLFAYTPRQYEKKVSSKCQEQLQPDFIGFTVSREKQIVAELMNYAKCLSCPEVQSLNEKAVEECLNIDTDVPVALQLRQ